MEGYKKYRVEEILKAVDNYLANGVVQEISSVADSMNITKWSPNVRYLTLTNARQMRVFLREARYLEIGGYAAFQIQLLHGNLITMWAYRFESLDGRTPEGQYLYRKYSASGTYWDITNNKGDVPVPGRRFNALRTIKDLEEFINSNYHAIFVE